MVNQKMDELKELPRKDFVDRVRNYSDQDKLNFDEDGNKKNHQVGIMAEVIEQNNYEMTDNQYYSMVNGFAKTLVPDMKVVGTSFRDLDPENYKKELVGERRNGVVSTYDVDYHLKPEPDNPYDENAVGVWIENEDNKLEQLGYLPKDFVSEYELADQVLQGQMVDHSNGKFKNVSYHIAIDTEGLHHPDINKLATGHEHTSIEDYAHEPTDNIQLTSDDLFGLEDDSLEL